MKKIIKSFLMVIISFAFVLLNACDDQGEKTDEHTHHYSTEWTIDKEATCTEVGSKSHHCHGCNEKSDITAIPATGHSFDEWKTTKEPTEVEEGTKERECRVCHYKEFEKIPVFIETTTVDSEIWNTAFNNIYKVDNCKITMVASDIRSSNTIQRYNDYFNIQMISDKDASDFMYYTKNSNIDVNYIGLQQNFTKVNGKYYDIDNKNGYETLDELIEKEGRKWTFRYGSNFESSLAYFKFIDKFDEFNYDNQAHTYFYQGEMEAEFINIESGEQNPIKCQVSDPIIKFKNNHIEYLKLNAILGGEKCIYEYESVKTVMQQELIDSYWEALFTFNLNEDGKSYSLCKANIMNNGFETSEPVIIHLPEKYQGLPVTCIGQNAFIEYSDGYVNDRFPFSNITLLIPSNIKNIGVDAFCSNFKKIYYDGFIDDWCKIEFVDQTSNPMFCDQFYMRNSDNEWEEPANIVIPNDTTNIGVATFSGCESLTSVVIPKSVTKIGLYAFLNCRNLIDVYYEGSPTEWSNISIENGNNVLNIATIHYNFGSDHETSQKEATKEKEYAFCHYIEIEKMPIITIERIEFILNIDSKGYSISEIGNVYNNLPVYKYSNFRKCNKYSI